MRREVLGGLAVATAALSSASADAAIVYSGKVNLQQMVAAKSKGPGLADVYIDVSLPGGNGFQLNLPNVGTPAFTASMDQTTGDVRFAEQGGYLQKLSNESIDAGLSWLSGPASFFISALAKGKSPASSEWNIYDTGIVGFEFNDAGAMRYGWARITLGSSAANTYLVDYAYENTGAAILAGAIPEPGSAWLVLLAGAGLLAQRRRR